MTLQKAIFLMGPTASGKTNIACQLFDTYPLTLISVDSAQVYQELDIGSAKPDKAFLSRYPHHLINVRTADMPYSAADFLQDVMALRKDIPHKNTPLLVGGTMLYFKALLAGLADLPSANNDVRANIVQQAEHIGWPALHASLAKVDPIAAERIKPNDKQRITRALEVVTLTGKTLTELTQTQHTEPFATQLLQIALVPENREMMHKHIEQRFVQMVDDGLIDEVENLKQNPKLHADLPAIRSVGYRQVWAYLDGEYDKATMIEKAVAATRQLAKRQMTWLRSWPDLHTFDPYNKNTMKQINELIKKHLY